VTTTRELADIVGVVGQNRLRASSPMWLKTSSPTPWRTRVAPEAMRRRVEDTLDLLGLHELRDRPLPTLSGGQQQRVAIGAVLSASPGSSCSTSQRRPSIRLPPKRCSPP